MFFRERIPAFFGYGLAFAVLLTSGGCKQIAGYGLAQAGDGGTDGDASITEAGAPALIMSLVGDSPMVHGQCREVHIDLPGEVQSDSPLTIEPKIVDGPTLPAPSLLLFSDKGCTQPLGDPPLLAPGQTSFTIRHEVVEPATSQFMVKARVPDRSEIAIGTLHVTSRAPATALDAANDYSCAVVLERVYCWGSNALGQLGDGTRISRGEPRPVPGLEGAIAIATGENHACAIAGTDQTVYCWGDNGFGQLGTNEKGAAQATPQVVRRDNGSPLSGARLVTVGRVHSCAVVGDVVFCWGGNGNGQLGDTSTMGKPVATQTNGPNDVTIDAIRSGDDHVCLLAMGASQELRPYCWGRNTQEQVTDETPSDSVPAPRLVETVGVVSALDCGARFCCAIEGGQLRCWGDNNRHQLDFPDFGGVATSLLGLGTHYGCARAAGRTQCWGQNDHGQLAGGERVVTNDPVAVPELATAVRVTGSEWHGCARDTEGLVSCWGRGDAGQLARDALQSRASPVKIGGLRDVTHGAAGLGYTCVQGDHLQNGYGLHCWGLGSHKQLGIDANYSKNLSAAIEPLGVPSATAALAASSDATCALSSGQLHCWGSNWAGQLGRGTTGGGQPPALVVKSDGTGTFGPVEVIGPAQKAHFCAISNGSVYCWGENGAGQIDYDETTLHSPQPFLVQGLADGGATAVATGMRHSCAIIGPLGDGDVHCWGGTGYGQCGTTNDWKTGANTVSNTTGALDLALGDHFSCAIVLDAALCWGKNNGGQLGDGSFATRETAATVGGALSTAGSLVQIVAGGNFACALDNAGKVMCWGANQYGQRGDGSFETTAAATTVDLPADDVVEEIFAGYAHACAITFGRYLYCWGSNATGTLSADWNPTVQPPRTIAVWGVTPSP